MLNESRAGKPAISGSISRLEIVACIRYTKAMNPGTRRGFSIDIFLPDGTPDGLKIVEKSNWTGKGVVCPRSLFGDAKKRSEFQKTGIYVLLGPGAESGLPIAYIGEGDPLRPRLEQHAAKKDFWTTAVLFLSKDENLNKAHVQYLEARLVQLAREAKRCELENGNEPQRPSLSEADVAEVEGFLDEMLLCFPVLGVSIFEKPAHPTPNALQLFIKVKGLNATGYESPQGFVVRAQSAAVTSETPSCAPYLCELRHALHAKGILLRKGDALTFTQDYAFDSPSMAAGVVRGANSNGRVEWKTKQGVSLKEIQEQSTGSD